MSEELELGEIRGARSRRVFQGLGSRGKGLNLQGTNRFVRTGGPSVLRVRCPLFSPSKNRHNSTLFTLLTFWESSNFMKSS